MHFRVGHGLAFLDFFFGTFGRVFALVTVKIGYGCNNWLVLRGLYPGVCLCVCAYSRTMYAAVLRITSPFEKHNIRFSMCNAKIGLSNARKISLLTCSHYFP